ncbi:hypothetical protein [Coleofasciculus sp. H7-2]
MANSIALYDLGFQILDCRRRETRSRLLQVATDNNLFVATFR